MEIKRFKNSVHIKHSYKNENFFDQGFDELFWNDMTVEQENEWFYLVDWRNDVVYFLNNYGFNALNNYITSSR